MTKLKKKKSKKRTKSELSIFDLKVGANYEAFCNSIQKSQTARLKADDYLFGLSDEVILSTDCFKEVVKKWINGAAEIDSSNWPEIVSRAYLTPDLSAALDCLAATLFAGQKQDAEGVDSHVEMLQSIYEAQAVENAEWMVTEPVVHQILYGEIPLTLGLLFPFLKESDELIDWGRQVLATGMEELLDGDGLPNGAYVSKSGQLLAIWTRCLKLCDLSNTECFDVDGQTQFEFFTRQMLRLVRKDGSLVFSSDEVPLKKLLQSSLSCYHDDDDVALASILLSKSGKAKKVSVNSLPESSANSEWGELAVMQTEWLPKSPKLTVRYGDRKILAELSNGGVLLSGEIQNQIILDDKSVSAKTEWEVVCWHSDQDGDFLEMECELENGAKWQKHFLLARNEQFLLVGDALMDTGAAQVRFESSWPKATETGFGLANETNELFLTRKAKTAAAVIPVSIPEWKIEKSDSSVAMNGSNLDFVMAGTGENLYCPLFFDLDPKRCRKPLTWRQLTVAEQLEIVPKSDAVGYRIHVGDQQWMIYRSLIGPESRTVFGQNLTVEFYVGSFETDGTCSEIISVD